MGSRIFNIGDSVILVGGVCDGLSGVIITAEDAARLPDAKLLDAAGIAVRDDATAHLIAVKFYGRMVRVSQMAAGLLHAEPTVRPAGGETVTSSQGE